MTKHKSLNISIHIRSFLLAALLAFPMAGISVESVDAHHCWGGLGAYSYGNSSGYTYVSAQTGCSSTATLQVWARISRNGQQVSQSYNSGFSTVISTSTSGTWCQWTAVGYERVASGEHGWGWMPDLWSC